MNIKYLIVALALAFTQSAVAESDACDTEQISDSGNPIIGFITIPFKAVVALTYGPRCLIDSIPKNE